MAADKLMRVLTSLLLCVCVISSIQSSAESSRSCSMPAYDIRSQCPNLVDLNRILEVDGEFLETLLAASKNQSVYTSILFYASWCPFSRSFYSLFKALSFMYPRIEHVAVELSSATPSLLSRFGVHSVPAMFIMKQSQRVRFRSSKDLISLVKFYEKTTGYEPVHYIDMDVTGELSMKSNMWSSLSDMFAREPYLVLAIAFLCLRAVLFVCQKAWNKFVDLFTSIHHFNTGFGEARLLDGKRVWSSIRLSKNSNFHFGYPW